MKNTSSLHPESILRYTQYILVIAVFFSIFFSGCTAVNTSSEISDNQKITVVTSFYPLQFFLSEIGGEKIQVNNLAGSASPHSYQLTPKDIIALHSADLVIIQGGNFEPWGSDIIPQLKQKKIPILEIMNIFSFEEKNHDEHKDEHKDQHNHGGIDPHTWLDPVLAQQMAQEIAQSLISVNPENSQLYQKNLKILSQKLDTLDTLYKKSFQNCKKNEVISSHDAFNYMAKRYGFSVHSIAGLSPNDEPSAKTLGELKTLARTENLRFLLTENNNVKRFSETLSRETGLEIISINPMGRGTFDSEKDFFDISHENLQSFITALECQ